MEFSAGPPLVNGYWSLAESVRGPHLERTVPRVARVREVLALGTVPLSVLLDPLVYASVGKCSIGRA